MTRFILHPGMIQSRADGDLHYVSARQLAALYRLKPEEYRIWREHGDLTGPDEIHLYPRYDGAYRRP